MSFGIRACTRCDEGARTRNAAVTDWIVKVQDLCRSYRDAGELRRVLDGVDFELLPGEVLAVTGPSGSGKSTLLNLLAGMLEPDSGSIVLRVPDGIVDYGVLSSKDLRRIRRRHIGYVFQFFNLVPTLTVRENVLLPLELNRREDLTEEALERLAVLGLGERLNDFPEHLSGGERQRTAIARALAHRPSLVIADEPTGNLDAATAHRVAELLMREVRQSNNTLVMATHNEAIAAVADHRLRLGD